MTPRGDILILAKTKLADRPVVWREEYTKRALFLKRQFHEILGPGSYYRWEGHDTDTDDDYFVVVGPAKVHSPEAAYFAGVRKLPADYAAGGLYFSDMKEAMDYASETWGVTHPKGIRYYDSTDLKGISEKIKEWKDAIEENERGEEFLREWLKEIQSGEGESMSEQTETQPVAYFYQQSDTYPFFMKVAMPEWLRHRTGFRWWDIDEIASGSDADFNLMAETEPSLQAAKDFAMDQRTKRRIGIARMYGSEYVEADFYKIWLVHRGDMGTYLISVGPYTPLGGNSSFEDAFDKFGVFKWKLNLADNDEIAKKVNSLVQEYAEKFGVQLTADDINVPLTEKPMVGEITVNPNGRAKIYGSPEWKRQILDFYNVTPGRGMMTQLKKNYKEKFAEWKAQLDAAYAESQENGDAFKNRQPPPPEVDLSKRPYGQQISSTIYRQKPTAEEKATMTQTEIIQNFGFDSIKEAVDNLNSTVMQGAPINDVPNVTTADLAAARAKHKADIEAGLVTEMVKQRKSPSKPAPAIKQVDEVPIEKVVPQAPAVASPDGAFHSIPDIDVSDAGFGGLEDMASSLSSMLKMAADLDSKGLHKEAEDIHKILRKHISV